MERITSPFLLIFPYFSICYFPLVLFYFSFISDLYIFLRSPLPELNSDFTIRGRFTSEQHRSTTLLSSLPPRWSCINFIGWHHANRNNHRWHHSPHNCLPNVPSSHTPELNNWLLLSAALLVIKMFSWANVWKISFTASSNLIHAVSVRDAVMELRLPDYISQLPYLSIVGVCM
jgi:hypothetical protein